MPLFSWPVKLTWSVSFCLSKPCSHPTSSYHPSKSFLCSLFYLYSQLGNVQFLQCHHLRWLRLFRNWIFCWNVLVICASIVIGIQWVSVKCFEMTESKELRKLWSALHLKVSRAGSGTWIALLMVLHFSSWLDILTWRSFLHSHLNCSMSLHTRWAS